MSLIILFLQAVVEVFAEEQDNRKHRHGDVRVGEIEHRAEEQGLAGGVVN